MLLPTDEWTLVLAGIPELLLLIMFLCMPLSVHTAKTKIVVLAKYLLCDYLYYENFMNTHVLGADT